jgi:hypothetical protein
VPRLLVSDAQGGPPAWIEPSQVVGGYGRGATYPLIDVGLARLVRDANPLLLAGALLVYAVSVFLTSYRWHRLLGAMDIHLEHGKVLVLNQIGAFYNNVLPGSTGGDVAKAYYASLHTPWRTRSVLSVLVDRILGLLALVLLGGVGAAYVWARPAGADPAAVRICQAMAVGTVVAFAGLAAACSPSTTAGPGGSRGSTPSSPACRCRSRSATPCGRWRTTAGNCA